MCGIAGLIGKKITNNQVFDLKKSMNHRGPDNFGEYYDSDNVHINLWHSRLSIIDLNTSSNQPFSSTDKRFIIVFNGEIYNFKEIKDKLLSLGYIFKTSSDTEVLLNSFIEWNVKCLNYLEGMFAFSIWDKDKEILFSARDRFGEKPFYYSFEKNIFAFASEIRTLRILRDYDLDLNKKDLVTFLKYQNFSFESSIEKNIKSLLPGHYLILEKNKIEVQNYWDVKNFLAEKINSNYTTLQSLKLKIIESIDKSLISDVPLGVFLSGGIDSSIITAVSSKYLNKNISTFSVCFDDSDFVDRKYARYVSELYKTNHNEIYLDLEDLPNIISKALDSVDNPTGDGINTWLVSRAVKKAGISVAISGIGADEIFGGYTTFDRLYLYNLIPKIFRNLSKSLIPDLNGDISPIKRLIKSKNIYEAYGINRTFFNDYWIKKLVINFEAKDAYADFLDANQINDQKFTAFGQTSYMELMCYMSNVLLKDGDQMSMAHSLEVRAPFLNHKVIETLQKINYNQKFKYGKSKLLLKNMFKDDFNNNFWDRPKQGFVMPWDKWMRNELRPLCEDLFEKSLKQNLFSKSGLCDLRNAFYNKKISWSRYWLVLSLTNWVDKNKVI
jgi:asparagine synthase (glutamine-hydrolysing)